MILHSINHDGSHDDDKFILDVEKWVSEFIDSSITGIDYGFIDGFLCFYGRVVPIIKKGHISLSGYRSQGLYFYYLDGLLAYIGKSKNLYRRMKEHLQCDDVEFESVAFIQDVNCSLSEIEDLEIMLIQDLQPPQNVKMYKKLSRQLFQ